MDLQCNDLWYGRWYLKPKLLGKVRRRIQEVKNPSVALVTGDIDLSHNESIRLATDALLDRGLDAYQKVLAGDGEVDFLSLMEKGYILENAKDLSVTSQWETEEDEDRADSSHTAGIQAQTETYFPAASESEPPVLDHGWPVQEWTYHLQGRPRVEIYFQYDGADTMKDLVRGLIHKATTVLAIVMDTFSDLEIFCDILEATMKRNVSVYLLLDHIDLQVFVRMCETLQIDNSQLRRMSVRCVEGVTYCAKSGKKFPGQIKEKFMIVDCSEVLAGSYSFTWLSWLVHRNMAVLFKGSAVKPFDLEFRKLYASSKPVPAFITAAATFDVHRPFIQTLGMFATCPSGATDPVCSQTDPSSPRNDTALPTPTARPCYSGLHPAEVKAEYEFNTQLSNPNYTGQITTTAQLRQPSSQPTGPSISQTSVNQGHGFDWITQTHTAISPVVPQRSFMGWRPFNSNQPLKEGMSSTLVDRHPVLKTGQWFTVSQQLKWHCVSKF
ncbi:hypothetical protein DPEC_G00051020 [Dallia pectoralis]|uniref:Uncharacterized protein n=1 Tax=Dallia pectoralis TaxID=75939 RepID=A0ACC2HBW8_DALPE|nr:hypothetical protein DPEC_G00051020 [Dallia pectoralis]